MEGNTDTPADKVPEATETYSTDGGRQEDRVPTYRHTNMAEATGQDKSQLIPGRAGDGASGSSAESGSEFIPLQMEDEKKRGRCNPGGLRVIIISAVSFSVVVTVALIITIYFGPTEVLLHQAVSSDSRICSEVGTQIIQDGGSSVDAAVATTLCIGVVQPTDSGLGGAGYMIIRNNAKKTTHVFDFMATAPSAATADMFDDSAAEATEGGKSVGVPGLLQGLKEAHDAYGSLSWKKVVAPSIKIAREGFNVSQRLAEALSELDPVDYPGLAAGFANSQGQWVVEGDVLQQPELATLLENIAANGSQPLYTGTLAQEIITEVSGDSGVLTLSDLQHYQVVTPTAIALDFLNQTVESVSAPSGGPVVLAALNILTNFLWTNTSGSQPLSYQHIVEALNYGYGQRGMLGDPYLDNSVSEAIKTYMINASSGQQLASRIQSTNSSQMESVYGSLDGVSMPLGASGTTITVFGQQEEMVAVSVTLGNKLGSRLRTPSGIILNSLMGFFNVPAAAEPNQANNIEAGKRPVTPLAPTVTYSAEKPCSRRMAVGGGGGQDAHAGIVEVLLRVVGFRESLKKSIDAERLVDFLDSTGVHYEAGLDASIVNAMRSLGYMMTEDAVDFSPVNAVAKINETVEAYSDPRGSGAADIL